MRNISCRNFARRNKNLRFSPAKIGRLAFVASPRLRVVVAQIQMKSKQVFKRPPSLGAPGPRQLRSPEYMPILAQKCPENTYKTPFLKQNVQVQIDLFSKIAGCKPAFGAQ